MPVADPTPLSARERDDPRVAANGRQQDRPHIHVNGTATDADEPALAHIAVDDSSLPQATTGDSAATARRLRRATRREGDDRPRAPRAERAASSTDGGEQAENVPASDAEQATDAQLAADALVINLSGNTKRGARTVRRAHKMRLLAADAVKAADVNPALGALNRHLNMMVQQLGTAHRVIGRVAAERDALRQQLADLQGIPVEEIVVTTIGASPDKPAKTPQPNEPSQPSEPPQKSALSRLNYFGGDDVAVMRKRRQSFALALLVLVAVIWVSSRMGVLSMPANVSRESLTAIPLIGEVMPLFLAGWILFRMVKVSSKGVKWVFPSEDQRRRRR